MREGAWPRWAGSGRPLTSVINLTARGGTATLQAAPPPPPLPNLSSSLSGSRHLIGPKRFLLIGVFWERVTKVKQTTLHHLDHNYIMINYSIIIITMICHKLISI